MTVRYDKCPYMREANIPIDNGYSGEKVCLKCPLEKCVYDNNYVRKGILPMKERNENIRQLFKSGKSVKEISAEFGLTIKYLRQIIRGKYG